MLQRLKRALDLACGSLAALALFAIMLLTLVDVTGRKLASQSVTGSLELTELLMVAVIFAALPLVSLHGEHVVFDSLDPLIGRALRRVQTFVVEVFCALALSGVAWLMWQRAGQVAEYGDTSAQLKIPIAPAVYAMAALAAAAALVHLLLIFAPTAHHHPGTPEASAP